MKAALSILACAAAGWLAGEIIARTVLTRPKGGDSPAFSQTGKEAGAGGSWSQFLSAHATPGATNLRKLTIAELKAAPDLKSALNGPTSIALHERIATASLEEFPSLLELVYKIGNPRLRRQSAEILFSAWAEHDPQTAIAAVSRFPALSMSALNGAVKIWAEKDPREFMAWLNSPATSGWARMQAGSMTSAALIDHNPEIAMKLVLEMPLREARLANEVFQEWWSKDASAANQWYASAGPELRERFFQAWISAQAGESPELAWQNALESAPDAKSKAKALSGVFNTWKQKDLPAAADALAALPADAWQANLAEAAGNALGRSAQSLIPALSARVPESVRPSFWHGATKAILDAKGDPAIAAQYLQNLPADHEEHPFLAHRLTHAWLLQDKQEAASAWVKALPRGKSCDRAAAALADGLKETDPEAALAWAQDIENDFIRQEALRKLPGTK